MKIPPTYHWVSGHTYCRIFICLILLLVPVSNLASQPIEVEQEIPQLSVSDFSEQDKIIYISDVWKFQPGDNSDWANPALVDTSWQPVSTYLSPSELPFIDWQGIGWFRLHFKIDSSLVNYPLALLVQQHNGASEIYMDGNQIFNIGQVSNFEEDNVSQRNFSPIPVVISDTMEHVLAVRYANYEAEYYNSFKSLGYTAGFRFLFGDLNYHTSINTNDAEDEKLSVFFIGSLLAFSVIHLLLYLFYPTGDRNLYFALFTVVLAMLIYALHINGITESPFKALLYYRVSVLFWLIAVVFALRFTYSLLHEKLPVYFWVFSGFALVFALLSWFTGNKYALLREIFVMVTLAEIIRTLIFSLVKKRKGVWIVALGLVFFVFGIFYKVLIDLQFMYGNPVEGSIYGSAALVFAMSVYLSRDFAKTNRQLEQKLLEVKQLSERSLKQERVSRQKEVERKLLKAENERTLRELEEARSLQLSMLPKKIPSTEVWDIAVFMETAHEVGGDYYDFNDTENGELTIAIGDATGHGMKAGIMVAAAKSYFHTFADKAEILDIFEQMSTGIRNMDLKTMFMAFQILKCQGRNIKIASAGMPPVMWYKKEEQKIDELVLKGLPLGTKACYPYKVLNVEVLPGDFLLLMSDGLLELFDKERRQLGRKRIIEMLNGTDDISASEIMEQITALINRWSDGKDQEDDITIMVMKAKA